jgi:hypothetical protein
MLPVFLKVGASSASAWGSRGRKSSAFVERKPSTGAGQAGRGWTVGLEVIDLPVNEPDRARSIADDRCADRPRHTRVLVTFSS